MTNEDNDLRAMEPLINTDRCDRCGAQALVRVSVSGTDLLFCGHHFADAEVKIRPIAEYVYDERQALIESEKPTTVV